jgi:TonB-dependent receptor
MPFRRVCTFRVCALVVLIILTLAVSARGQSGRGTLTGTITDTQGASLQGVKVALNPGGATAVTDATGQFTLIGVAAGQYTVTASYAGFTSYVRVATVTDGKPVRVDAALQIASNKQDVQVYAPRQGGELEAINRTINADNIINVLPADVITSLPNANIADALGRLPSVTLERDEGEGKYVQIRGTEPRLTNTTIDGVNIASAETVRQIKLDIIPADLVESVQINKTLQANMPGDGIGGSVDLRTKSAMDSPTISLEGTGGYTPIIGGRPAYQFDGTLGKRFLADKKLGVIFSGSYDWNGRGINDLEPGPVVLGGYDERDYQYYRQRLGFAGTLDYKFSDTSNIYLKGLYSLFHNYGNRWDYNFATTFNTSGQPDGTGTTSFGAEVRRPIQDLGSLQLGGRHVISRSLLSWDTETSVGRTRDKGYSDASFAPGPHSNLQAIQYGLDVSKPLTPKLTTPAGINVFDPAQYFYTGQRINNYYNPEVDLGFGASLATSYTAGSHAGIFEFGGRFRNVHKFANQDTRYYIPTASPGDPSLSMTRFLGSFTDPDYYGKKYLFGPTANYDKINAFQATVEDISNDQLGNNFNFIEKVSAGYVMNTIELGRFRVLAGLRFENTSENDAGNTAANSPSAPITKGSYLDVLPSASVRYALTPTSGLRAVYGRGLSRPDFSDLVSFASISPGGVRTLSSIGNPNLKAEHADNLDLLYENNLRSSGLLQAGIFYKHLSDPIIPLNTIVPDPANPGKTIIQTQPQNAGSAFVYGFEIAYQQHFNDLPGLLGGLGLSANYGYSASQVKFPAPNPDGSGNAFGRSDKPNLLRQAPNTWNLSPTYDRRNLSVRLGLSYNASNIFAYNYNNSNAGPVVYNNGNSDGTGNTATGGGIKGPNGDQYLYSHLQTDLQGSYRLGRGFTAVAYGLNLNNEVFGFYQGSTNNPLQREFYKATFGGGLRWSPGHER